MAESSNGLELLLLLLLLLLLFLEAAASIDFKSIFLYHHSSPMALSKKYLQRSH